MSNAPVHVRGIAQLGQGALPVDHRIRVIPPYALAPPCFRSGSVFRSMGHNQQQRPLIGLVTEMIDQCPIGLVPRIARSSRICTDPSRTDEIPDGKPPYTLGPIPKAVD